MQRVSPGELLFLRLYSLKAGTPHSDPHSDKRFVAASRMPLGVYVDVLSLPRYPRLTMMSTAVCMGRHQLTVMFWDDDGPRRGLFVLTDVVPDACLRPHKLEVYVSDVNKAWVISVVASAHNNNTSSMMASLLSVFKHILWLRRRGLFVGTLCYRCTVAGMEDRTRLVFGPLVTNKALLVLMMSWLPIDGVIDADGVLQPTPSPPDPDTPDTPDTPL